MRNWGPSNQTRGELKTRENGNEKESNTKQLQRRRDAKAYTSERRAINALSKTLSRGKLARPAIRGKLKTIEKSSTQFPPPPPLCLPFPRFERHSLAVFPKNERRERRGRISSPINWTGTTEGDNRIMFCFLHGERGKHFLPVFQGAPLERPPPFVTVVISPLVSWRSTLYVHKHAPWAVCLSNMGT